MRYEVGGPTMRRQLREHGMTKTTTWSALLYYLQKRRQRMKGTRGTKFSVCLMLSHVIIIMRYQFDRRVEENVINACVLSSKTEERGRRMNSTP